VVSHSSTRCAWFVHEWLCVHSPRRQRRLCNAVPRSADAELDIDATDPRDSRLLLPLPLTPLNSTADSGSRGTDLHRQGSTTLLAEAGAVSDGS
ncbi:MAG: hypothetical protein NZU63_15070, partial [Gemmataceae bacterium]|nr:hypothetical protein [Gemmataceae bacterium]